MLAADLVEVSLINQDSQVVYCSDGGRGLTEPDFWASLSILPNCLFVNNDLCDKM